MFVLRRKRDKRYFKSTGRKWRWVKFESEASWYEHPGDAQLAADMRKIRNVSPVELDPATRRAVEPGRPPRS